MQKIFYRAGAISYVIWGLLHLEAARKVYALGSTLEPGMGLCQTNANQVEFVIPGFR